MSARLSDILRRHRALEAAMPAAPVADAPRIVSTKTKDGKAVVILTGRRRRIGMCGDGWSAAGASLGGRR